MATSSSDESSTAPKDFHLSSSVDSGSRLSPYHHKCQLCNNFRKKFICKDCVQHGDFSSSLAPYGERFADKQQRLFKLKSLHRVVEDRCCEYLSKKQKIDDTKNKIRHYTERIRLLKLFLQESKEKQETNKSRLKFLMNEVKASNIRLPKYDDRVEKLERYVAQKSEKVVETRKQLNEKRDKLKKLAKIRVHQLIEYIFPIEELQPSKYELETDDSGNDTVSALAEATRTAYVKGRWIFTDTSGELRHKIVAPSLPGSGDYTAYSVWLAEYRNSVQQPTSSAPLTSIDHSQNPAFSITAALTYTAQLVGLLSFYLDVRLPHKLAYSDFCTRDLTEHQFSRRIARLNANVLQLCFSQNIRPEELHAKHTLTNLTKLLEVDLGRLGPVEVEPELIKSLEGQLIKDLDIKGEGSDVSTDDDDDEGDTFPYEWEAVPHVQCPELNSGNNSNNTSTQQQQTTSIMAGGLVTSAAASFASFWRGWTAGK